MYIACRLYTNSISFFVVLLLLFFRRYINGPPKIFFFVGLLFSFSFDHREQEFRFSYMTAGGSRSLMGSSSLRFPPGPFLVSPRREDGRKRYKSMAKATHTMAIIANPLSPVPWPGPGSPS